VARNNYKSEKRRKELKKAKKRQDKEQRKELRKEEGAEGVDDSSPVDAETNGDSTTKE